jgi:two-component system KDP operon response regulator KdpE
VQPTVTTDDFTIDLSAGRVTANGDDVKLTPTEWHLLEVLARNAGRVLGHEQLLTEVWGPAYRERTNYLRVYMATLRRKLEPDAAKPRHLLTEAGRGYRFEP